MSWATPPDKKPLSSVEVRKTRAFDVATSRFIKLDGGDAGLEEEEAAVTEDAELAVDQPTSTTLPAARAPPRDDEVYDAVAVLSSTGEKQSNKNRLLLAVATNSEELRLVNMASGHSIQAVGHTQSVLCVDSPDWDDALLASGSKDNSVLFWRLRELKKDDAKKPAEQQPMEVDAAPQPSAISTAEENLASEQGHLCAVDKVAIATGHTHSVTSIAFSHSKTLPFLVSVSHDSTLKLWPLTELIVKQEKGLDITGGQLKLSAANTFVAHSKDINSVDVSANDRLCVTASMDKTAKLWHIDRKKQSFTIGGTLAGHKRGVWCARFSKNLQLVATCSGDCTIKLFSLLDRSCTRTLEGHQFAVLSVLFIDNSTKLVSVDGGGLLKLWTIQKGLCERTEEAHAEKIWCLRELPSLEPSDQGEQMEADDPEEEAEVASFGANRRPRARFVTGAADGLLALWEDRSEVLKAQRRRADARRVTDQQTLANLLGQDRMLEALLFALELGQPFQCLNVLKKVLGAGEAETSAQQQEQFIGMVKRLNAKQLATLLEYACQWNTNTRTYMTGQQVLNCVLRSVSPNELLKLPNIESIVKRFLPYSIRHNERLSNLRKNAAHVDYMFSCMRLN